MRCATRSNSARCSAKPVSSKVKYVHWPYIEVRVLAGSRIRKEWLNASRNGTAASPGPVGGTTQSCMWVT